MQIPFIEWKHVAQQEDDLLHMRWHDKHFMQLMLLAMGRSFTSVAFTAAMLPSGGRDMMQKILNTGMKKSKRALASCRYKKGTEEAEDERPKEVHQQEEEFHHCWQETCDEVGTMVRDDVNEIAINVCCGNDSECACGQHR
jgi:hypothetical protein